MSSPGERSRAIEAVREYVWLEGPMEEIVRDPLLATLRRDSGYAEAIARRSAGRTGTILDIKIGKRRGHG
jgi:hypothetical protein